MPKLNRYSFMVSVTDVFELIINAKSYGEADQRAELFKHTWGTNADISVLKERTIVVSPGVKLSYAKN